MALMKTSIFALLGLAALSVGLVLNFVIPGIRYYVWIMLAHGAALLAVAFIFDLLIRLREGLRPIGHGPRMGRRGLLPEPKWWDPQGCPGPIALGASWRIFPPERKLR